MTSSPEGYRLCTTKLRGLEETCRGAEAPEPLVLVMCGSFSPVHKAHIGLYDAAITALVKQLPQCRVLGGFFSPVSDHYGKEGLLSCTQRSRILEAALAPLEGVSIDCWEGLQPCYTPTYTVLCHLEDEVRAHYAVSEPTFYEDLKAAGRDIRVAFVCGADLFHTFLRPDCWPVNLLRLLLDRFLVVVVDRPGSENVKEHMSSRPENCVIRQEIDGVSYVVDLLSYDFVFSSLPELDDSSSTTIRRSLDAVKAGSGDTEVAMASLQKMLPSSVPLDLILSIYAPDSQCTRC